MPGVASPPLEDSDLDSIFQVLIVGLTGLPGNMVRPRWQPSPPKQPEATANWCALGVTVIDIDSNPAVVHNPAGNGSDTQYQHEKIEILCSFYGPLGQRYAAMFRDGLKVSQTAEYFRSNLMGIVGMDRIISAPELFNQTWFRRYDMKFSVNRQVVRTYAVLNIVSAPFSINANNAGNGLITD